MKRSSIIAILGAALLLTLAGILAVVIFTAQKGGFNFDKNSISAEVKESKTLKVDGAVSLTVKDDAGSVKIVGADVKTVKVEVIKRGHGSTESAAEVAAKDLKYKIEQTGNKITISYTTPNSTFFDAGSSGAIDFIITVPNDTAVNVDNNFGDISVVNTNGNASISNDFGDITADKITGALSISTNSGEVTATSIKAGSASIDLKSNFGSITLEDASAEFLNVETNSGSVSLTKININKAITVNDDFGDIELNQALAASYDLHTNNGSITVDGAKGKIKSYTDFGGITVINAKSATLDLKTNSGSIEFSGSLGAGPHSVKSDFGGIDITLPSDTKVSADLKTDFGSINSELPITIIATGNSNKDHLVGNINGGGDELVVKTNSGSINIKTGK